MVYDPLTFWEDNAEFWIKKKHQTDNDWEAIKEYVNQDWKVIELGCGTGRWAPYFKNYTGVDISPSLIIHASKIYPDKQFFHHDMRAGLSKDFDLVFTYTSWLHVPPEDMSKIKLPDTNYLFVEPKGSSSVDYCFKHDYEKLFGVKKLKEHGKLIVYGKFK